MEQQEHALTPQHAAEHAHPTPAKYIVIAVVLTAITVLEVGIYYIDALRPAFAVIFLSLSVVKFAFVALYYMHLKFDPRIFSGLFFFALALATAIVIALLGLFGIFVS